MWAVRYVSPRVQCIHLYGTLCISMYEVCLSSRYTMETVGTGAGVHGDDEVDRRALEDAVVEAGSGRGMYVVGSRWHGGTMIAMLRQMESATYGWRYGGIG